MGPEDFGIYGGIGKSWNDRYSIELAYWLGCNYYAGGGGNFGWSYEMGTELLKLSFGYRFDRFDFTKKQGKVFVR